MFKPFIFFIVCFISYSACAESTLTKEQIADQRWSSFSEVANLYLSNASAQTFVDKGDKEKNQWNNYPGALSFYLMATDRDHKNSWAPYQAAGTLSYLEFGDLAIKYLQLADKNGFWQYFTMKGDDELNFIKDTPEYKKVLANVKQRYQSQALDAGKAKIFPAKGKRPKAGWPVVIWLSGYGTEGSDSQDLADAFADVNVILIGINGTQKLNEHAFRWSRTDTQTTQDAVMTALKQAKKHYAIDTKKVVLMGFSQGALHATHLLAAHPDIYSGALILSPGGYQTALTPSAISKHNIVVSYGEAEHESNIGLAKKVIAAFSEKNDVQVHPHTGEHFFAENWQQDYPKYLSWIINN